MRWGRGDLKCKRKKKKDFVGDKLTRITAASYSIRLVEIR
jgi:hypothetical protein